VRNNVKSKVKTKHLGRSLILTNDQEKEFCSRILRYSEIGMPVTASILKNVLNIVRKTIFLILLTNQKPLLGDTGFTDF